MNEIVLEAIKTELHRQNNKWGIQDHNVVEWMAILTEEVGEASKEAVGYHFKHGGNRIGKLKIELIQVAAVAIQMIDSIDRQLL